MLRTGHGADFVIAVDNYCSGPRADGLGAATMHYRVMHAQSYMVAAQEMAEADVLIAPPIYAPKMSAVDEQRLATQAGYDAAGAALPQILARVGSRMAQRESRWSPVRANLGGFAAPDRRLIGEPSSSWPAESASGRPNNMPDRLGRPIQDLSRDR